VFALILIRGSFVELPIVDKALSRWVMALIIRVKALKKVVVAAKELAQSARVVEPEEVSTSLATAVLLGVIAWRRRGAHKEL
jgi:hypothetical protein